MKARAIIYLITIFLMLISMLAPVRAENGKKRALVLYDDLTKDYGVALINLLGHFYLEYNSEIKYTLTAQPEEIEKADALFILAAYNSILPPSPLLKSIEERKKNPEKITCFIGTPPWLKRSDKYKIFTYVSYKGWKYRGDYGIYPLEMNFQEPIAFLESGEKGKRIPLISKEKNLWIVQGFPFFDVHSWILADALHDILGVYHTRRKSVFLRLEDVNPSYTEAELKKLNDCINYLYSQGVPYTIAVYPVFINYKEGEAITLLQNEKLILLLKKAERMGGSIIMHGTSHQYREVSGEGSEFWDMLKDKPLPNEKEYFNRRMRYGLWLFKKAGLTPLFFESPHYNLPLSLQKEMHMYFSTILGELMINNKTYKTTQTIPFIVYKTYTGLTLLPEQLGYIAAGDKDASIKSIEERAIELEHIVRDPMVCFFYHPYLDGDKPLRELIPFFRDHGFRFIDVARYGSPTSFKVRKVPHLWKIKEKGTFYFGKTPAFLAVLSVLVLLTIYLRLSSRRKRRLFEK